MAKSLQEKAAVSARQQQGGRVAALDAGSSGPQLEGERSVGNIFGLARALHEVEIGKLDRALGGVNIKVAKEAAVQDEKAALPVGADATTFVEVPPPSFNRGVHEAGRKRFKNTAMNNEDDKM